MTNFSLRILLFIAGFSLSASTHAASVAFDVNAQDVTLGSEFSLVVMGSDFPAISGGGLTLLFDPAVLQITSVTINTSVFEFYIGDGPEKGVLNNSLGSLTNTAFNSIVGATGNFSIMTIKFTAIGSGTTMLSLSESSIWVFSDTRGNAIGDQLVFGETHINVSPVPVSAAFWLLSGGLLILASLFRLNAQSDSV